MPSFGFHNSTKNVHKFCYSDSPSHGPGKWQQSLIVNYTPVKQKQHTAEVFKFLSANHTVTTYDDYTNITSASQLKTTVGTEQIEEEMKRSQEVALHHQVVQYCRSIWLGSFLYSGLSIRTLKIMLFLFTGWSPYMSGRSLLEGWESWAGHWWVVVEFHIPIYNDDNQSRF